jgi:hypothetical protein
MSHIGFPGFQAVFTGKREMQKGRAFPGKREREISGSKAFLVHSYYTCPPCSLGGMVILLILLLPSNRAIHAVRLLDRRSRRRHKICHRISPWDLGARPLFRGFREALAGLHVMHLIGPYLSFLVFVSVSNYRSHCILQTMSDTINTHR